MSKKSKTTKSPDKLAKIGKKSGVELNEAQLGQVTGGRVPIKDPGG